jgi:hypothetical protein
MTPVCPVMRRRLTRESAGSKLLALPDTVSFLQSKFRFNSYSLKVVTSLIPNAYERHFFHDYFCRQVRDCYEMPETPS